MFETLFIKLILVIVIIGRIIHADENELSVQSRIVGGRNIAIQDVPYMARLEHHENNFRKHICGAVIISEFWVLTAAHCTKNKSRDNLTIRIGSDQQDYGRFYVIDKIINHKKYRPTLYDISLIKVPDRCGMLLDGIRTKAIKLASKAPKVDSVILISGFGADRIDGPFSKTLRQVEVHILERYNCELSETHITKQHLCQGIYGTTKGTCIGDGGGPVVLKSDNTLVGIHSFGSNVNCSNDGQYSVSMNVAFFRKWIKRRSGV